MEASDAAVTEAGATADAPLPLPYVVDNDAKRPLPGVQSIFLTGSSLSFAAKIASSFTIGVKRGQTALSVCRHHAWLGWCGRSSCCTK